MQEGRFQEEALRVRSIMSKCLQKLGAALPPDGMHGRCIAFLRHRDTASITPLSCVDGTRMQRGP